MNATVSVLHFQDTYFDITDINGQPWLRGFQIGSALGYQNPRKAISDLYNRNADEFDDTMTRVINLPDLRTQTGDTDRDLRPQIADADQELDLQSASPGQNRQVRLFSLRGCHLLGMLAKTETAKAFRRWVLDVLQEYAERARRETFAKIHGWQYQELRGAANRLSERTGETQQSVYARFFRQFSVRQTADLPRARFAEALDFLQQPAPPECYHPQLDEDDVRYLQAAGCRDGRLQRIAAKNRHLLRPEPQACLPEE